MAGFSCNEAPAATSAVMCFNLVGSTGLNKAPGHSVSILQ